MKVKKHNWINGYNRIMIGDNASFTLNDATGARLEKWTFAPKNEEEYDRVIWIIYKKYGWKPKNWKPVEEEKPKPIVSESNWFDLE